MTLKKRMRKIEGRLQELENFCHKVESILELSMEFNPFSQCCKDPVDQLILKILVERGRATTTQLETWIKKPMIEAGRKPITRYAVFHRLKKIRAEALAQEREQLLVFHAEKSDDGLFRFWAPDPLLIDELRRQAAEVDLKLEKW